MLFFKCKSLLMLQIPEASFSVVFIITNTVDKGFTKFVCSAEPFRLSHPVKIQ